MERYLRNQTAISKNEQILLANKHILIAGCGGLGGYITELLARIGVGYITVVDGDVFNESNLNRQLFCTGNTLGKKKALAAAERISLVNPLVQIQSVCAYINEDNVSEFLSGKDVVVDALDNKESRRILMEGAEKTKIPLVHGAIAGWTGRVAVVYPGDDSTQLIFSGSGSVGLEQINGNLSFTAALVASFQAAETVKLLIGRGNTEGSRLIEIDLLNDNFECIFIK